MREGAEKGKSEKQFAGRDLKEVGLRLRVSSDSALGLPSRAEMPPKGRSQEPEAKEVRARGHW